MPTEKQHAWKSGNHLEQMLDEGKYREWFWSGLQADQLAFLRTPAVVPEAPPAEPIYKNQEFPQARRWRDEASCRDADPVIFFGEDGADQKRLYTDPDAEWRQYCPQCPVQDLCLELARESGSVGIFGGKYFTFAHKSNFSGQAEYDEDTIPKQGRPSNSPRNVKRRAAHARKRDNAGVSST